VRRRGEEEAMFKPACEVADGAGELRLDAIATAA